MIRCLGIAHSVASDDGSRGHPYYSSCHHGCRRAAR